MDAVGRRGTEVLGGFQRAGAWEVATAAELGRTGYPVRDADRRYLVTTLEVLPATVDGLFRTAVIEEHPRHASGAPWTTTWAAITGTDLGTPS